MGAGSIGRVFLCHDYSRNRYVTVKVALAEGLTPEARDQMLQGAERAMAVRHENVCPVYDFGLDGDRPYVVMPYCREGTLARWRKNNKFPTMTEALDRALDLARGLAAIHAAGLLHLALKPDNVLVDGRRFMITDFAFAPAAEGAPGARPKGTTLYMSPEQWRAGGAHRIGPRSDIFSLGVIVFELLTNAHPFPWRPEDPVAQSIAAWTEKPRAPSEVLPAIDPRLDALCLRALATAPGDRYATAQAFADEIAKCRDSVGARMRLTAEEDFKKAETYFYGSPGIPRDFNKARKLFERAASQGYAPALNSLGSLYQHSPRGCGVPRDYAKAHELFLKAADQGDARAQNNLGFMYQQGLGVTRDYARARQLYLQAVQQGDAAGYYNLGSLYLHALGVPLDYAKAFELYTKAAEQGLAKAQNGLGYMYQYGLGVPQDYETARAYFEQAADQGFGIAQNSLGYMYLKGLGVARDYDLARQYFEKAAGHDVAQALNSLGYLHQYGLGGVERNYGKARELYEKAAKKGLPEALFNLGRMYHNALGVKRDYETARELYRQAAARGDEDAKKALLALPAKK
jgi:TPR repeat protein